MTLDPLIVEPESRRALVSGEHTEPHQVLGPHTISRSLIGSKVVLRAFHPDAVRAEYVPDRGAPVPMSELGEGLFGVLLKVRRKLPDYRIRFVFARGTAWEHRDPYRFESDVDEDELRQFADGVHGRLYDLLGSHPMTREGTAGTRFTVWAPHARSVRVVGDFCAWDGRLLPMRRLGDSGVWELFVPGVGAGEPYKYEILTAERQLRLKSDPFARAMEPPPDAASRVVAPQRYGWGDQEWLRRREAADLRAEPVSIYEVHLGSWDRSPDHPEAMPSYRQLAPRLIEHALRFGFTHLELMPIAEHAFYGSWGYQVTGYFAPTQRYGSAEDLRWFVDQCHRNGLGVLLDWVPVHFPKDDYALRRFDGPPLFEVDDPVMEEHPDWGTLNFDVGRPEVRNFLLANALYWLREFHFDGLRVDAVSWLLYLDYGREEGQWTPNRLGGRDHLEGIAMLRELNALIEAEVPGAITVAEESASWPGVTAPVAEDGLGFTFKWNMGWMNDTLTYFSIDPAERPAYQELLTFSMQYEGSEHFVNPLSHDEVVHLKKSLLAKMPRDPWQKLANLRALLAYQFTRPGKKLLFMGTELAPEDEWNHDQGLDWSLWDDPQRRQLAVFLEDLGALYRKTPCLWRGDAARTGFAWIDGSDHESSVLSFVRFDGDDHVVVALNLSPVPRDGYRIGVPGDGRYRERLSSDDERYGGSAYETLAEVETDSQEFMGWRRSVALNLPPLGALVLEPAEVDDVQEPPPGAVP